MTELVRVSDAGGVREIRLDRPEKKNALTGAMYDAMANALRGGAGTRAMLLTATGDGFCAGNDIGEFLNVGMGDGETPQGRFIQAIATCGIPVVAAVRGAAVGVGMTMLLHCDLVFAASGALLSVPFVRMGLVPEAGSSRLLPAILGPQRAARLVLLGEAMTAEEARDAGLVTAVVEDAALEHHARAAAERLAAQPPRALATARDLMRAGREALHAHMEREREAFGRAVAGPEAREAFTAFLEKRPPNFPV